MSKIYAAIDLGASSGRVIVSYLDEGIINSKEIHRFKNGAKEKNGRLCWDIDYVFENILLGLEKCKTQGYIPNHIGIDTWGVDFALVGKNGELVDDTVCYRDSRTDKTKDSLDDARLYAVSGIQKMAINTVYHLAALKQTTPEVLDSADCFMMIPDYLGYLLTGVKSSEYTNASTTGMLDAEKRDWSCEILGMIGLDKRLFLPLSMPSTSVGMLKSEIAERIGYNAEVVHVASHDTASAVIAYPKVGENSLYISSGTWSLLGTELDSPCITDESRSENFTNEGGYNGNIRFLKNIMGLWMIQSVKNELEVYSFEQLSDMAEKCGDTGIYVNVNDHSFLAPKSMIGAIKDYCKKDLTTEEILSVIYHNLARYYAETIKGMESVLSKKFDTVCIVGGGSRDKLLNALTEKYSGKKVLAGPVEATALGNVISQMIYAKEIGSVEEAREIIRKMI